ncbi:MAG: phospholipase D family protein [Verrucomicrobiota bacterium]|jgi:phosphatidylserine/phosphatidylglycerophosphate/cardiolipin synthase-like enzyme
MAYQIQIKKPLSHSLKIAVATIAVFACVALLTRFFGGPDHRTEQTHDTGWQVYFSPGGGCTDAIVEKLAQSKVSVLVQAYSFTSARIAKALADAKSRGVTVSVILDKGQLSEQNCQVDVLAHADIKTLIDSEHASSHNKVMVVDSETVITGSFNFTTAAEANNAENLLIIRDKTLAQRYTENWYAHSAHSKPFLGK